VKRVVLLICTAGIALVSAGVAAQARVGGVESSPGTMFDYDASAPLGLVLGRSTSAQGIVRQDLSFQATTSLRLRGYFIHPAGAGPWPLVIWSPGAGGDRNQQLPDARAAAQQGLASLLLDVPANSNCRDAQAELDSIVSYVVSRRRAVDAAGTLPGVDTNHIAAAGFSQGAEMTGLLSAVEHRITAFALKSARGHLTGYIPIFCTHLTQQQRAAYIAKLSIVDPVHWIRRATRSALLMQNGTLDNLSPRADVLALYAAARKPKELRWYPAGHDLNASAAAYRLQWLIARLHPR
jgi:cephalosporin-C deacetylase-like acetyl esterase